MVSRSHNHRLVVCISYECWHQRTEIELHCRVRCRVFDSYLITLLGGIDRRMIALCLCIVESPDRFGSFVGIRKLPMITNPDSKKITLELFNFIGITLWWLMWEWKINAHFSLTTRIRSGAPPREYRNSSSSLARSFVRFWYSGPATVQPTVSSSSIR